MRSYIYLFGYQACHRLPIKDFRLDQNYEDLACLAGSKVLRTVQ